MKCPHCEKEFKLTMEQIAAAMLGMASSEKKTKAARENAKKGGWPKGKPRKKKP